VSTNVANQSADRLRVMQIMHVYRPQPLAYWCAEHYRGSAFIHHNEDKKAVGLSILGLRF